MDVSKHNSFIFSSKYRIWRHIAFWFAFTLLTSLIYVASGQGLPLRRQLLMGLLWLPVRILYCYPLMYWVFPKFLLKGKYVQLGLIVFLWFVAGWFINY